MNKLIPLLIFSVLFLVPLGSESAYAALVSHWEAEGDYTDSADGNNGTPINEDVGFEFTVGQIGQGFDFDGVDDHVLIGDQANLEFGTGDFAVSAWTKTSFLGGSLGDFIVSKISTGADAQYIMQYRAGSDGTALFGIQRSSDNDFAIANSPCSIADGQFHHLVGVRQGLDVMLYLDGVLVGTGSSNNLITSDSSNAVVIGGRQNSGNDPYFNGVIDDVRIFNHALSPSEVQSLAVGSSLPNLCLDTDGDFIEDSIDPDPNDPCDPDPNSLACLSESQTVGGEIIPIESTSLILAGAQSFSWMIPFVISAVAIGIFVVSRKN